MDNRANKNPIKNNTTVYYDYEDRQTNSSIIDIVKPEIAFEDFTQTNIIHILMTKNQLYVIPFLTVFIDPEKNLMTVAVNITV